MTEEQERAAFEAWYDAYAMPAELSNCFKREKDDPDEYEFMLTHLAWKAWKARAALLQSASPAPEAPTDEQLIVLAEKHCVWSKYGLEDAPKLLSFCRDVLSLSQRNRADHTAPTERRS